MSTRRRGSVSRCRYERLHESCSWIARESRLHDFPRPIAFLGRPTSDDRVIWGLNVTRGFPLPIMGPRIVNSVNVADGRSMECVGTLDAVSFRPDGIVWGRGTLRGGVFDLRHGIGVGIDCGDVTTEYYDSSDYDDESTGPLWVMSAELLGATVHEHLSDGAWSEAVLRVVKPSVQTSFDLDEFVEWHLAQVPAS